MEKILVLGTGKPQADLIRECKKRGMEAYACSYTVGDPGQKYADGFENINIVDAAAVKDYAKRIGADYIYSAGSDVAMPTVFRVAKELGLPAFCPFETANICNKKPLLRAHLGEDFEGNLKFQCVTDIDEPLHVGFPMMMKPSDSQGQRGVCLVRNMEEYRAQFDLSMSFSREKKIILEEYVEGDEISVNTFSVNGKVVFCLPSDRIIWSEFPGGIIHRHLIPTKFADCADVMAKINDLVARALDKLDIKNGPAYFQIMVNCQGDPKIIEVTPRLDGCHMWRLIEFSTGVNLLSMAVDLMTGKLSVEPLKYTVKPYETEFLCMAPGSEFTKSHFDLPPYEYLEWYYEDGGTVKRMNGFMEKTGYIIKKL